jgi:hypothetical protein
MRLTRRVSRNCWSSGVHPLLWRPCLLMGRDEMCNLHRGPSIDASYQVLTSFGLAVSEEKIKMWKVNGSCYSIFSLMCMFCRSLFVHFSSPCQRQCELLPSLGIRHLSSVNFSHFNLLLWNPSAKWTETREIMARDIFLLTKEKIF